MEELKGDKIQRVLQLYAKLSDGYVVNKSEEAQNYGVNERSIQRDIDDIVLNAQQSALKLVKSGVESYKVDRMARDIIEEAGYGDCFGHSTGHGVGLDIHENPTVSPKSSYILSDGMVITIEPGIYLNNQFGVRIEDMILVQLDTYHNFATLSKELIIV